MALPRDVQHNGIGAIADLNALVFESQQINSRNQQIPAQEFGRNLS